MSLHTLRRRLDSAQLLYKSSFIESELTESCSKATSLLFSRSGQNHYKGMYTILIMPSVTRLNGQSNFVTTVILPLELYDKARALDINFSETLREALTDRIDAEGILP